MSKPLSDYSLCRALAMVRLADGQAHRWDALLVETQAYQLSPHAMMQAVRWKRGAIRAERIEKPDGVYVRWPNPRPLKDADHSHIHHLLEEHRRRAGMGD